MLAPQSQRPFALAPIALLAALVLAVTGCDRPPSASAAREWTPTDHDHADEKGKVLSGESSTGGSGKRGAKGDKAKSAAEDVASVVELTWQKQCSVCHGPEGRGDGPNGPLVKAPDLTAPDWQAKISDAEMALTIKNGRGMMPKFDMGDDVIAGLVGRVRALGGRGAGAPGASGSPKGR